MENRELIIGGFYKHFKDKLYQVRGVAYHSETKEKMVVYQALYGDYSMYVRPYDMFLSEVDHEKYPDVKQKYRFTEYVPDGSQMPQNKVKEPEMCMEENVTKNGIHPGLEKFLDADTYQEKMDILKFLSNVIDDKMIDTMAAALEIEVPEGSIDSRYQSVMNCLRMKAKYECNRLR